MHLWIFICAFAALANAVVNHVDKHLISKYFQGFNIGALVIITSLVGIPVLGTVLLFHQDILNISVITAFFLVLSGISVTFSTISYFLALNYDEATRVAPLFQMVPIISFILGFFFLGETLTLVQLLGSAAIMGGSVFLTAELSSGKSFQIKKSVLGLMLLASFFYAMNIFAFRVLAIDENFWKSLFWEYIGVSSVAVFLLVFVPYYRKQLLKILRKNSKLVIGMAFSNELFVNVAKIAIHYATLIASVSMVTLTAEGLQPVFVFLVGIALTLFFPKFGKEDISPKILFQKGLSILFIVAGSIAISI